MADQMLVSIVLIIASMLAGVVAGLAKKKFSDREKKFLSYSMTGLVFILIFLMGIKTGLNQEVIAGIGVYGLKALLIALAAIGGSVLFAFAFDRLVLRSGSK